MATHIEPRTLKGFRDYPPDLMIPREQLMETLGVCVYMGGGPTLMYAAEAVRAYEEFTAVK